MDTSPRLLTTAARLAPEAGNRKGKRLPLGQLPPSGSWLHEFSPSEHTYPCDDDGVCFCAHCMGDYCECEDCIC